MPAEVLDAPATDASGRATSLATFRGRALVLGGDMTLSREIGPLLSANFTSRGRRAQRRLADR